MRVVVETERDRERARKAVEAGTIPFTVNVAKGRPRSYRQNRLMRQWVKDLEEQGDMSAEEYRGWNKAYFGIPILLNENEYFAEQYEKTVRPLDYETKLALMQAPFDFPVTRLMTVDQERRMLDAMYEYWTGQGFRLTDPDAAGLDQL